MPTAAEFRRHTALITTTMPTLDPRDPDFETRAHDSFARQRMMWALGADLAAVRAVGVRGRGPSRV